MGVCLWVGVSWGVVSCMVLVFCDVDVWNNVVGLVGR